MSGKHPCGQTEQFLPLTWLPVPSPVLGGQSLAAMWSWDMTGLPQRTAQSQSMKRVLAPGWMKGLRPSVVIMGTSHFPFLCFRCFVINRSLFEASRACLCFTWESPHRES